MTASRSSLLAEVASVERTSDNAVLLDEIDCLRAALVEERAKWIALYDWEPRQGTWAAKDEARAELIAEGLLPPDH
jgi:hypothetical protein